MKIRNKLLSADFRSKLMSKTDPIVSNEEDSYSNLKNYLNKRCI